MQVGGSACLYHLFGDEGHGDWCLFECFCHLRCCKDCVAAALFQTVYEVGEPRRLSYLCGIEWIEVEQLFCVVLGFVVLVLMERA